jgi:hypothetical protein
MKNNLFEKVRVDSSAISTASYLKDTSTLRLIFQNGAKYDYKNVPDHVYEGLRLSDSKGSFLNKYIIRNFSFDYVN